MGLPRGRIGRSGHSSGHTQSEKAGFANLSRYFQHMAEWRDRKEVAEALQAELIRQVKETPSVPTGPTRRRKKPWGDGSVIQGGESKRAMLDPKHKKHVFKFLRNKIQFGASTPGVIFNRKRYAHGIGTVPRINFVKVQQVVSQAILDVPKSRNRGSGRGRGGRRRAA